MAPRIGILCFVLVALLLGPGCANKPSAYPFDISVEYAVSDPEFERVLSALCVRPLVAGNSIKTLRNGDEIFPAMLDSIAGAKRSICFETFIYWSGVIATRFADTIVERARAGVAVHVLVDAIGAARMDDAIVEQMRQAGVDVRFYNPVELMSLADANFRTHRKILVVDGEVGFTGGVGIGDKWLGDAEGPDHWRENHYRVTGPVVAQLQSAFFDNWVDTTGEVLHGEEYYPELTATGPLAAQIVTSSSESDGAKIQLMMLLSFAAARNEILLETPYFVPDDLTVRELIRARQRGVRVRVLVPGQFIDSELVRRASRVRWRELMEQDVEIWEYEPTMVHCKLLIVDQLWVSVGSSNFDNRSFSLNDEANLNVLDRGFAAEQRAIFEDDLQRARRVTLETLDQRSCFDKLIDGAASLLSPQL